MAAPALDPAMLDCWSSISAAAAVVRMSENSPRLCRRRRKGQEAVLVTILCDSGDKYSERTLLDGRLKEP